MPSGEDPFSEKPPAVVAYFRIYAVLMSVIDAATIIFGLGGMAGAWGGSSSSGSGGKAEAVFGIIYALVGLTFLAPHLICLMGGRRKWVYTLGAITIILGMLNGCCLPIAIPLLVMWIKPEVKAWHNA